MMKLKIAVLNDDRSTVTCELAKVFNYYISRKYLLYTLNLILYINASVRLSCVLSLSIPNCTR